MDNEHEKLPRHTAHTVQSDATTLRQSEATTLRHTVQSDATTLRQSEATTLRQSEATTLRHTVQTEATTLRQTVTSKLTKPSSDGSSTSRPSELNLDRPRRTSSDGRDSRASRFSIFRRSGKKQSVAFGETLSHQTTLGVTSFDDRFEQHFSIRTNRIRKALGLVGGKVNFDARKTILDDHFNHPDEATNPDDNLFPARLSRDRLSRRNSDAADSDTWITQASTQPEMWGMKVRFVNQLHEYIYEDAEGYGASHLLDEEFNHICLLPSCQWNHENVTRRTPVGQAQPLPLDMHLVVQRYVKPWTKDANVGLALLFNSGFSSEYRNGTSFEELCKATVFVSHSWSGIFSNFKDTLLKALSHDTVVWICSFAIWQHGNISDDLEHVEQSPFARALRSCDLVLACTDSPIKFYERCWCVFEAALSMEWNKVYHLHLPGNGLDSTQLKRVSHHMQVLDLSSCKASVDADKLRIVAYADSRLGGMTKLNAEVRSVVTLALEEAEVMCAASRGDIQALKMTTGNSDSMKNWRSGQGQSVLHVMAEHSRVQALIWVLSLTGKSLLYSRDDRGMTPLAIAVEMGSLAAVSALINLDSDVNTVSIQGMSPLHFAAVGGREKITDLLVTAKGDMDAEACYLGTPGRKPLCIAVREGHLGVIGNLLLEKANVNIASSNGVYPLFLAASRGLPDVVAVLISAAADVNAQNCDKWGRTALQRALLNGHTAAVAVLCAARADPHLKDKSGKTSKELALQKAETQEDHCASELVRQIIMSPSKSVIRKGILAKMFREGIARLRKATRRNREPDPDQTSMPSGPSSPSGSSAGQLLSAQSSPRRAGSTGSAGIRLKSEMKSVSTKMHANTKWSSVVAGGNTGGNGNHTTPLDQIADDEPDTPGQRASVYSMQTISSAWSETAITADRSSWESFGGRFIQAEDTSTIDGTANGFDLRLALAANARLRFSL